MVVWNGFTAVSVSFALAGGLAEAGITAALLASSISTVLGVGWASTVVLEWVVCVWSRAAWDTLADEVTIGIWALEVISWAANVWQHSTGSIIALSFASTAGSTFPSIEFWAVLLTFWAWWNFTALWGTSAIDVVGPVILLDFTAANVGVNTLVNTSVEAVVWLSKISIIASGTESFWVIVNTLFEVITPNLSIGTAVFHLCALVLNFAVTVSVSSVAAVLNIVVSIGEALGSLTEIWTSASVIVWVVATAVIV